MANVRAKFQVSSITEHAGYNGQPSAAREVKLQVQYDDTIAEDQRFYDATPSGDIRMLVNNPAALEQLSLGKKFYVDFILID